MYGSCYNDKHVKLGAVLKKISIKIRARQTASNYQFNNETYKGFKLYFVLINTPYSNDRVSSCCEESVQSRVKLEGVHPISIILFHLVSNNVGDL